MLFSMLSINNADSIMNAGSFSQAALSTDHNHRQKSNNIINLALQMQAKMSILSSFSSFIDDEGDLPHYSSQPCIAHLAPRSTSFFSQASDAGSRRESASLHGITAREVRLFAFLQAAGKTAEQQLQRTAMKERQLGRLKKVNELLQRVRSLLGQKYLAEKHNHVRLLYCFFYLHLLSTIHGITPRTQPNLIESELEQCIQRADQDFGQIYESVVKTNTLFLVNNKDVREIFKNKRGEGQAFRDEYNQLTSDLAFSDWRGLLD